MIKPFRKRVIGALIIAECSEDNYHKVERTLNREVLIALREKNIPVK
jgi:hypothetical protein